MNGVTLTVWAQEASGFSAPGLSIKKDRQDNIHVAVDRALIPYIKPARQNGKLLIDIPQAHAQNIQVEAILKQANVVEVKPTALGKQITIQTDAVYWDLNETEQKAPNQPTPHKASSSPATTPKPPAATLKPLNKPSAKEVPSSKPQAKQPKTLSANPTTKPQSTGSKPVIKTLAPVVSKAHRAQHTAKKIQAIPEPRNSGVANRNTNDGFKDFPLTDVTASDVSDKKPPDPPGHQTLDVAISDESQAVFDNAAASGPSVGIQPDDGTTTDSEETALLNWEDETAQQPKNPISAGLIFRLVGSLIIVLALLVGFMKGILPKWVPASKSSAGNLSNTPETKGSSSVSGLPAFFQMMAGRFKHEPKVKLGKAISKNKNLSVKADDDAYGSSDRILRGHAALRRPAYAPSAMLSDTLEEPAGVFPKQNPYMSPSMAQAPTSYPQPALDTNFLNRASTYESAIHRQNLQKEASRNAITRNASQLERLGEYEPGFQLLNSVKLNREQELHLVDVRGRQLVIATSPYAVHLVTEMTGEQRIPSGQRRAFLQETARQVQSGQEVYKKYLGGESRKPQQRKLATEDVVVLDDYDDVFSG
ncbi:MAG: flagellar biosynthetic protein FliO [Vampirovibrionales bacterium]|nr:flagellar biosynthetic protein FliO [Vampirovibrionales bacterium]